MAKSEKAGKAAKDEAAKKDSGAKKPRSVPKESDRKAERLIGRRLERRADPAQLLGEIQERTAEQMLVRHFEVRSIDAEARTVELAFASETPVMRWFGEEVLSLEGGAMRTDRLEGGLALLVDHDWRDQVGVVESHTVGDDRIARAVVRLGRGTRASEIFADIEDGIRRHVSVGYQIHGVSIEEREGMPDLVTMTEWEPYEISMVSVPADPNVGVGRSAERQTKPPEAGRAPLAEGLRDHRAARAAQTGEGNMKIRNVRDANGNLVRAKVDDDGSIVEVLETIEEAGDAERSAMRRGSSDERERAATLIQMGAQYDARDLAQTAISEGHTPEQFQRTLLERMSQTRGGSETTERGGDVGLSDREADSFSFMRVLRHLANPGDRAAREAAAFEIEAGEAAADRLGRSAQGVMVPPEVLRRALNTSTSATAAGDTGGYLVATDLLASSFIDLLRNRTVFLQRATALSGLVGLVDIPKLVEGTQGYWIGEDQDANETSLTFGQVSLAPKTAAGMVEMTRRMLMQSSLDLEAMVRRDLAWAIGSTIDRAGFYGTGAANDPVGVANWIGINAVPFAAANPTFGEVVQMETEVAADNADIGSMAYMANARMRGHFKTTERFAGTGKTIWEDGGTVNGYAAEITNQVSDGDLFFGNWSDALVGLWGGLDLTIDPYTHSRKGRLRVVAFQDVDIAARRVSSFSLGQFGG
ncbi:phage major capsid protein [Paracoccus homiensis]|uniref:phage major capsid protein n=1 Tax=Paracoccus homiensis TaxID=364199 RepID=UPI00398D03C9